MTQSVKILDTIKSPKDLKNLTLKEKEILASEIRSLMIEVISRNGGHLAPNMGVVELTLALHSVFNAPLDKLVWDIGHQGYVHKILTGRKDFFRTLRQDDGCLGFLSRDESEYDVFGAGHAGTTISAALGIAAARDRKGGREKIIAIVGDGSLNCGVSLEALNHVSGTNGDFIIVLNDNKMSISRNVGGISRYLNSIITYPGYNKFKKVAREFVEKIPGIGNPVNRLIGRIEEAAKSILVPGVFFEELGIRYIGPIDGHNIDELIKTFNGIKEFDRPVIVHVITEKGHGYEPAEKSPERFHGLSCFDPETGEDVGKSDGPNFSSVFGDAVCELAGKNDKVLAITAGMKNGTGLNEFAVKYPERFFDVGIAEGHALVFASGMAVEGFRPVFAVYSTFLQRSLDFIFHDICLQNLPVIICEDRCGIVDDGPTHHGIHDLSFLRNMPNLTIMAPKDGCELRNMLFAAAKHNGPVIIRYPRGNAIRKASSDEPVPEMEWGKAEILRKGNDVFILAAGRECANALAVADILEKSGISSMLVNPRFLKPFDSGLVKEYSLKMPIITLEDCQKSGGLGGMVDEILINSGHKGVYHYGWGDEVIPHGTVQGIRRKKGLTAEDISSDILKKLNKGNL